MFNVLKIVLISLSSIISLFLLTKLTGNKQVSQLTLFDYINGITIGSIAAELATELENPLYPLTAMIVYGFCSYLCSVVSSKSPKLRQLLFGKTRILYCDGTLYRKEFKKAKIDISEFLMQCRSAGYFNLKEISLAIMEPSGTVSFMPSLFGRSATVSELKLCITEATAPYVVISDGIIKYDNLSAIKRDVGWLKEKMRENAILSQKEVFLSLADIDGEIQFYKNCDNKTTNDIYS